MNLHIQRVITVTHSYMHVNQVSIIWVNDPQRLQRIDKFIEDSYEDSYHSQMLVLIILNLFPVLLKT